MTETCCGCGRMKKTPRDEEEKKALVARLNRLTGQMNGVKKMIEEDRYCDDVLVQLAAIDKAIRSLSTVILEQHLKSCVTESVRDGNTDVLDEVVDLFRRFQ